MAIGIVSWPLRDRKLVAPNSPSEMAAASPAAATTGRRRWASVDLAPGPTGDAPSVAAASWRSGVDAAQHGQHRAHHERHGDERLADGTSHHDARQSTGGVVERDEHAEADRHGRRGDRQHQSGVEQPAAAPGGRDRQRGEGADGRRRSRVATAVVRSDMIMAVDAGRRRARMPGRTSASTERGATPSSE